MRKYHYTVGIHLPKIIESGEIRLATAFTFKKREFAVWTSTNPIWENTCNKQMTKSSTGKTSLPYSEFFEMYETDNILHLDMEGTHKYCGGLCRIEIDPKTTPFTINNYCRLAKLKKSYARAFIKSGINMGGNPKEWYAGFKPIPQDKWIAIEMFDWNTMTWIPYEEGVIPSGVDVGIQAALATIEKDEEVEGLLQGMLEGINDADEVFNMIKEKESA